MHTLARGFAESELRGSPPPPCRRCSWRRHPTRRRPGKTWSDSHAETAPPSRRHRDSGPVGCRQRPADRGDHATRIGRGRGPLPAHPDGARRTGQPRRRRRPGIGDGLRPSQGRRRRHPVVLRPGDLAPEASGRAGGRPDASMPRPRRPPGATLPAPARDDRDLHGLGSGDAGGHLPRPQGRRVRTPAAGHDRRRPRARPEARRSGGRHLERGDPPDDGLRNDPGRTTPTPCGIASRSRASSASTTRSPAR